MFEPRLHVFAGLNFLLKTNQWEGLHTVKGKENFGYAFVQNQTIQLSCLSLFKYSTLLWILSPHCYIPSLGHVVIQAALTQQAGLLFLAPLQTQCFGPAQPTGGGEGIGGLGGQVGGGGGVGFTTEQC